MSLRAAQRERKRENSRRLERYFNHWFAVARQKFFEGDYQLCYEHCFRITMDDYAPELYEAASYMVLAVITHDIETVLAKYHAQVCLRWLTQTQWLRRRGRWSLRSGAEEGAEG